jgi:uncharacterized protein YjbJ (UPF0337 family)
MKLLVQVTAATLLVAGCPVAIVWWLRASDTISSAGLCVLLGMGLSLCASRVGCALWEKRPGSEDLLFSELMIWGFLRRLRTQRRLASALETLGPMSRTQRGVVDGLSSREQAKLLERLVAEIETRDPYLHGHSRRVARHSWMIARRMGLSRTEVARIRTAAAIHDVGKIETPRAILHKQGPLSDDEYEVIKRHPGDGAARTTVLRDPELEAMVRHHHERLDGTGYPSRLAGEKIPLGARIIAVADTFDAITSTRPYRSASPHKKAIDILRSEAGTRLDPDVVRAFCSHYAGRRPLALSVSLASLPERVVSWLNGSVANVASVAKLVAVAGLVGVTAATTSTLAQPVAKHRRSKAPSASTAESRVQTATSMTASAAVNPSGAPVTVKAQKAGGGHAVAAASSTTAQAAVSSTAGAVVAQTSQPGSHVAGPGKGAGAAEETRTGDGKTEEQQATGVSKGAGEDRNDDRDEGKEATHGKVETPHGKVTEVVETVHNKVTEVSGKVEETVGKTTEAVGKTTEKATEATKEVVGKATEAVGKTKEEVLGKTTEVTGKAKEVLGKIK